MIVGQEGAPLWWGRAMDIAGARRTCWIGDDYIFGYDDSYVQNPARHPMEDLGKRLTALGLGAGTLGDEMDNYYFSAAACEALFNALPVSLRKDATGLVNWARAVKSPAEIGFMRKAAGIVSAMHARIAEVAEAGMPKHHLVAEILRAGVLGTEEAWGDYPAIVPLTPSGMDATSPHLTWDDRPLKRGEAAFFEIAGVYRRYHAPQSRTLFVGEVPPRYRAAEAAVAAATAAG